MENGVNNYLRIKCRVRKYNLSVQKDELYVVLILRYNIIAYKELIGRTTFSEIQLYS
jgi:hypothetical protein